MPAAVRPEPGAPTGAADRPSGRRRDLGQAGGLQFRGFGIGIKSSWEQALEDVRATGGKPYAIPAGASDHRLGGLGFANWAYEVRQQEEEAGIFFDTIMPQAGPSP